MDRREINHIVREAGAVIGISGRWMVTQEELERIVDAIEAKAAAKEREACAQQVIETREWKGGSWTSTICPTTAKAIATAIRARGATDGKPT